MLILGVVSVPSDGVEALQRPHCARHGTAAMGGHHIARAHDAAAPSSHTCPHCPASDCDRVAPCGNSTTTALSSVVADVHAVPGARVATRLARDQAESAHPPPDTPPPQPIA